ncbi:MAG TPA: hypothetical protein PLP33_14575 [Leptospiraceae bacterium]|nr:hypothetical protein [Leptospiraceae bacterium]
MAKTKNKPNLIIIIDGLNENKLNVFEQEINDFVEKVGNSLKNKKKETNFYFLESYFTSLDSVEFKAKIHDVSFYDIVSEVLKKNLSRIKESQTVIHIIHNTNDYIDTENKETINKIILQISKAQINFWTNISANENKALDFGVVAEVYSPTSAGIQTMISRMKDKTINFLKGKKDA